MSESPWRWCAASVIGSAHVAGGAPCQDDHAVACPEGETLIAAVADGAGSALHAEIGARRACNAFVACVSRRLEELSLDGWEEADLRALVSETRSEIVSLAEASGNALGDYACTFLAAVIGPRRAAFIQIGDGAIVQGAGDDDGWALVFWPQRGEYANSTFFLTDEDALERIEIGLAADGVTEIALLSDGLENSVLNYADRRIHAPFFEAMFGVAQSAGAPGPDAALSGRLADYLSSDMIDRRTSDDRTLVLATRRRSGDAEREASA